MLYQLLRTHNEHDELLARQVLLCFQKNQEKLLRLLPGQLVMKLIHIEDRQHNSLFLTLFLCQHSIKTQMVF